MRFEPSKCKVLLHDFISSNSNPFLAGDQLGEVGIFCCLDSCGSVKDEMFSRKQETLLTFAIFEACVAPAISYVFEESSSMYGSHGVDIPLWHQNGHRREKMSKDFRCLNNVVIVALAVLVGEFCE